MPLRWVTKGGNGSTLRLSPAEGARLQGFPVGYVLPAVARYANRGVGNAVPPPVIAAMLGRRGVDWSGDAQ